MFFISLSQLKAQGVIHLCKGESYDFSIPFTNGAIYDWVIEGNNTSATIISGSGTEHIVVDFPEAELVKLIVKKTNINGCSSSDSLFLEIHPLPYPIISAADSSKICEGEQLELAITSVHSSCFWNNGTLGPINIVDTSGDYFITVIDSNGCQNSSNSINVEVLQNPVADFNINQICVNRPTYFIDNSTVYSGSIFSKIWYSSEWGVANKDTVEYTYDKVGKYNTQLIAQSSFGCSDTINKEFTIHNNPLASFTFNTYVASTLNPEIEFTNTSENIEESYWDFGDSEFSNLTNPLHAFDDPGLYEVLLIVSDTNQCIDSTNNMIKINYDFVIHVATSFTPNGDGINDLFGPKGMRMDKYKSYKFIIFNRWGQEIFVSENINEYWDGEGSYVGTYPWLMIITDELGAVRKEEGSVLLIR